MSKELTTEQELMQATQYGLLIYAGQQKIHDEDERLKLEKIANEIKGHREAPNIKGCLLLIIGIKCEIKGVARQPLWEECNCNLEASEFFAETHLDKSRLRK